jgi:hypothetical protein
MDGMPKNQPVMRAARTSPALIGELIDEEAAACRKQLLLRLTARRG